MVRILNLALDDVDFKRLERLKKDMTWRELLKEMAGAYEILEELGVPTKVLATEPEWENLGVKREEVKKAVEEALEGLGLKVGKEAEAILRIIGNTASIVRKPSEKA
jgi:Cu/Ag efflux pump CusA